MLRCASELLRTTRNTSTEVIFCLKNTNILLNFLLCLIWWILSVLVIVVGFGIPYSLPILFLPLNIQLKSDTRAC